MEFRAGTQGREHPESGQVAIEGSSARMVVSRRLGTVLAAVGLGFALTAGPASAESTQPPTTHSSYASFESTLSAGQVAMFDRLPASTQAEMVALFSDPAAMSGQLTTTQIKSKYPDATVADSRSTTSSVAGGGAVPAKATSANGVRLPVSNVAHPMYTVYNVHSYYKHTVSILWTSNTAALDYYYQTGNNRVLSQQKCTWVDSGAYYGASIDSVSTNMYITSGNGHCDATVNLSAWKIIWSGYLNQNMSVNYKGIYSTYFYQNGP